MVSSARRAHTARTLQGPAKTRGSAGSTGATPGRKKRTGPSASPSISEPRRWSSLGQLLDALGPSGVQIIVAPCGLDIPVGEPLIWDPLARATIEQHGIVLGVSTLPDGDPAQHLVAEAGAVQASAVMLKLHGRQCSVAQEAERAGVALVAVPDEMSWTHLHELVVRAIRSGPGSEGVTSISSVPMGDLFALANAIAAAVGGAVTIEDRPGRVLAYSNLEGQPVDEVRRQVILGRQIPDTPENRDDYQLLWSSEGVRHIKAIKGLPMEPRFAVAVRAGGEILGSIWVMAGMDPPDPRVEELLLEASRIAALHIIHARASSDIERRTRGDLLRSLLEGHGSGASADRLGLGADERLAVIAFQMEVSDEANIPLLRERLVDLIAFYCEAFRRRASCVAMGGVVYAVLPLAKSKAPEALKDLVQEILAHAESALRVTMRAGIGSTVTSVRDLPSARRDADQVLRILPADVKRRAIATIEELWHKAALLELHDLAAGHPQLTNGPLRKIIRHDSEHETVYVETLRAYLDAFGDVPTAASRQGVHANTFRYRLRRLVELFGLDLDDDDERLALSLQLRLLSPLPRR